MWLVPWGVGVQRVLLVCGGYVDDCLRSQFWKTSNSFLLMSDPSMITAISRCKNLAPFITEGLFQVFPFLFLPLVCRRFLKVSPLSVHQTPSSWQLQKQRLPGTLWKKRFRPMLSDLLLVTTRAAFMIWVQPSGIHWMYGGVLIILAKDSSRQSERCLSVAVT